MADEARARRVADRIKTVTAANLESIVKDPDLGFVTLTDVRVTGDLQHASVFYTVFGDEEQRANNRHGTSSSVFRTHHTYTLGMDREGTGRTALVTGASAGIGAAFARLLARHGYRLALTARRTDRLETIAGTLRREHGVDVVIFPADLSDPAAPLRLAADLKGRGLRVDVLVNNAGYGVPGRFDQPAWETHAAFLQVMVTAVCELTYRLLPAMMGQGYKSAIFILIFYQTFLSLPKALEEAARLDGASDWRIFFTIALPTAVPAYIIAIIF